MDIQDVKTVCVVMGFMKHATLCQRGVYASANTARRCVEAHCAENCPNNWDKLQTLFAEAKNLAEAAA